MRPRRLRIEQLERMDLLSVLTFSADPSVVEVQGGTLTVSSIHCSTLIIGGAGGGNPGSGGPGTMSGGTLRYSSDAFDEPIVPVNGAALTCTDPADLTNAWRTTQVMPGGPSIQTPDGVRDFGPVTNYENRFGQIIATSQDFTDTIDGVTTQHTSNMANVRGEDSATVYAEDAIAAIVPATDLTVTTTDQGTVVQQTGQLCNQTVTRDGAEQLNVTDDGATRTVTIGPEVFTQPSDGGIHPNALAGPIPVFEVAHGTSVWAQIVSHCPSGDYSQPADAGSGFYSISENAPLKECNVTVMLFGTTGYSCNTLQSSDISEHAGTVKGSIQSWKPTATYVVNYVVEGTLYVTTADPSNPTLGGVPSGGVFVNLTDASGFNDTIGEVSVSSSTPITTGGVKKVFIAPHSGSVTVSCGGGSKAWVATMTPTMANRGPGLVVFVGMMQITSITLVPPPNPPGASPEIAPPMQEPTWAVTEAPKAQELDAPVVRKLRAATFAMMNLPKIADDSWMVKQKPTVAHDHYFSELGANLLPMEIAL